jgi:cell division protein FtsB
VVVRKLRRRLLATLALYAASAACVAFFAWHAASGPRGAETRRHLKSEIANLEAELAGLRVERKRWEDRTALLRAPEVDRDLLDERTRLLLNRAHRDDVIVPTSAR